MQKIYNKIKTIKIEDKLPNLAITKFITGK